MAKKKVKKKVYGIPYALLNRSARLIWMKSIERAEAVKRSKKKLKNPNTLKSYKQYPTCEKCGIVFYEEKDYQVHHINAVGSISNGWDVFFQRLFCPSNELLVLCKDCHNKIHGKVSKPKIKKKEKKKA